MSHGEGEYTALPWSTDEEPYIGTKIVGGRSGASHISTMSLYAEDGDAALIVRAVNHHDRLYALAVRAEQELICAQSYASSRRVMSGPGLAIMAKLIEQLHAELETIRKGE